MSAETRGRFKCDHCSRFARYSAEDSARAFWVCGSHLTLAVKMLTLDRPDLKVTVRSRIPAGDPS